MLKIFKVTRKELFSDLSAGFTTGLFSIPEGMAYAKLIGVNPVYGLYSSMVAPIAASLSTGTILMVSTLTSAIAICTTRRLCSPSPFWWGRSCS
jgi:SulP family sulfate permease